MSERLLRAGVAMILSITRSSHLKRWHRMAPVKLTKKIYMSTPFQSLLIQSSSQSKRYPSGLSVNLVSVALAPSTHMCHNSPSEVMTSGKSKMAPPTSTTKSERCSLKPQTTCFKDLFHTKMPKVSQSSLCATRTLQTKLWLKTPLFLV